MFDMKEKIVSVVATGGVLVVAGVFALLGLVWLSIAGFTALTAFLPPAGAMAAVGGLCLAPLAIWFLSRRRQEQKANAPEPAQFGPTLDGLPIMRLVESFDEISRVHPLGGVGLAFAASWIASRSPNSAALSSMLAAEAIERLVRLAAEYAAAEDEAGRGAPPSG